MERTVHGLEVVVSALLRYLTRLVAVLIHSHGREHSLLVPREVAGGLEKLRFRNVRGVDELIACLFVSAPRVVLHLTPNDTTLGVKDREPRADFVGKGEQVEVLT